MMQEGDRPNPHRDAEQRRFKSFPSWQQRRDDMRTALVPPRQKRQKTADERFDAGDQTIKAAEIQTVAIGYDPPLRTGPEWNVAPRTWPGYVVLPPRYWKELPRGTVYWGGRWYTSSQFYK